jgi:stage IV sporulation protein B
LRNRQKAAIMVALVVMAIVSAALLSDIYRIVSMPGEFLVVEGEERTLDLILPIGIFATSESEGILRLNGTEVTTGGTSINSWNPLIIQTSAIGGGTIEFRLFGLIPIKKLTVSVVSPAMVIPGGHSIGVKLYTQGVLVVALADFTGIDGKSHNPASQAGIAVGDSIIRINNIKVRDADHVIQLLGVSKGEEISIEIKRGKQNLVKTVKPVKSQEDGKYRIGAWVRDKTAGVGTLSFYYPETGAFGALGHAITDVDTGLMLSVEEGEILESRIASIQKGERSKPGEIRGIFFEEQNKLGYIQKNTEFGIFGILSKRMDNEYFPEPIPVALRHQVKEGPAFILTTVDERIGKFAIEIQKVANQYHPEPKSMVVKVSDERLLEATGGIVQGMSGSPIIQDGRLVGIVTHVFVNDPTRGYAIFAEWMVQHAEANTRNGATKVDKTE